MGSDARAQRVFRIRESGPRHPPVGLTGNADVLGAGSKWAEHQYQVNVAFADGRNMAGFWGHCQQSATFPSGRGFGYIAYRPRPDGTGSYNEGYVFTGDGRLVPARVTHAPWLSAPPRIGEDVSLILDADLGTVQIAGITTVSVFNLGDPQSDNALAAPHQAGVRYRWGDEVAAGALERSSPPRDIPSLAG